MVGLGRAIRLAKTKARHKCHKHAAIIFNKHQILAASFNVGPWHAEENALNLINADKFKKLSILVIRIRRDGKLGMSRPCPKCMRQLSFFGIRKIYYSDADGDICYEKT